MLACSKAAVHVPFPHNPCDETQSESATDFDTQKLCYLLNLIVENCVLGPRPHPHLSLPLSPSLIRSIMDKFHDTTFFLVEFPSFNCGVE